jgi:hypothetical protein
MLVKSSWRDFPVLPGSRPFAGRRLLILVSLLLISFLVTFWAAWLLILGGVLESGTTFPKIDFFAFWSASSLALDGAASGAYDAETIWREQPQLPGDDHGYHPWRNPPVFFFFVLPLSLLPVALSLLAWSVSTGALLLAAVRRVARDEVVLLLAIAFPAVFWNLIIGQNGFLTAGLLLWGVLLLRDRPVRGGVLLGLLAFKPQFFPLVLVALIAGRHKTAATAAVACVGLLSAASLLVFSPESWRGFISMASSSGESIYGGGIELAKVQSVSAVVLVVGLPSVPAMVAQVLVAGAAAAFVVLLWRSASAFEYKAAGLALAILLATPYVYHYDLTLLGVAILFLGVRFQKDGWRRGDAAALSLSWLAPISHIPLDFPIAPFAMVLLLAVLLRRVTFREVCTHSVSQVP